MKLLAQGGANDDNDAGFSLMRMTLPSAERKKERERKGTQAMRLTAASVLDLQTVKTDSQHIHTSIHSYIHRGSC